MLAALLLDRRGGLPAVLASDASTLRAVIPEAPDAIELLCAMRKLLLASLTPALRNGPVLDDPTALLSYLRACIGHERRELFRILYLDAKLRLLTDEIAGIGSIRGVTAHPREILRRALEVGAAAIIPVHNHPSGDPSPSRQDVEWTQRLMRVAAELDLAVPDHLIVTAASWSSLRSLGHMERN